MLYLYEVNTENNVIKVSPKDKKKSQFLLKSVVNKPIFEDKVKAISEMLSTATFSPQP